MATSDVVTQLFQNMFGRAPTTTELSGWVGILDSGIETPAQVAVDLLNSAEGARAASIERLYQAAFGRTPDLAGFKVQAGSGLSLDTLAHNFVGSAEFQATFVTPAGGTFDVTSFVTKLYTNILGRAPDAGGLKVQVDFYNSLIAADHSDVNAQATLLQNFANSPELRNNAQVNFDKAVLLWAGLDNTIPFSTTAAPSVKLGQANAIPTNSLASLLDDGINGNDAGLNASPNNRIQLPAGSTVANGTSASDTFTSDWSSANGVAVNGGNGIDSLVLKNAAGAASVTLNSVEQLVLVGSTAPAQLTVNIPGATTPGQIDTLTILGASGANRISINAVGVENIVYEADGAPGAVGSVLDFAGSGPITNVTIRGSQPFNLAGGLTGSNFVPGLKIDASATTGTGTIDVRSYFSSGNAATILGGSGGNTIYGSNGNDTIIAGTGNDVITGGGGIDTMLGGGGDDLFQFSFNPGGTIRSDSPVDAMDTVLDFTKAAIGATSGFDRIQITGFPAGAGRLAVVADKSGTTSSGVSWSVSKGVFLSNAGAPHLNGGFIAPNMFDTIAPNPGDVFVYSTGDFSIGDTYLFIQGGDVDLLVRLSKITSVGALNHVADNVFYLT